MKKGAGLSRVLFVCVHNAGRSQMAEAFLNHLAGGRVVARSAGTDPASEVNPVVREAMREVGIDIGPKKPRRLTPAMLDKADRVITMGCGAAGVCPAGFTATEDWKIEDPHDKPLSEVRRIRDAIKLRVEGLLREIGVL